MTISMLSLGREWWVVVLVLLVVVSNKILQGFRPKSSSDLVNLRLAIVWPCCFPDDRWRQSSHTLLIVSLMKLFAIIWPFLHYAAPISARAHAGHNYSPLCLSFASVNINQTEVKYFSPVTFEMLSRGLFSY